MKSSIIRRSVTIRPELDARIRDFISACTRHHIDVDYTGAFNLFAELGGEWLEASSKENREELRDVWAKYLDYEVFEKSVKSDWVELEEFRKWKRAKIKAGTARVPS